MKKKPDYFEAFRVLSELYSCIDDNFIAYHISLTAPRFWRPHLEKYVSDYRKILQEEGHSPSKIEEIIAEQDHVFSEEEFKVQAKTKLVGRILSPGFFENLQAKNTIKLVYDSWETSFRPKLGNILGVKIQGDIWGDLRILRHSITHQDSIGDESLKKAKIIKDFLPGHEIILKPTIMEKIRYELEEWYTEFSIKHFPPGSLNS